MRASVHFVFVRWKPGCTPDEHAVFLKTIIPSRQATEQYLGEESDHEE
jgi:hypothetical protein